MGFEWNWDFKSKKKALRESVECQLVFNSVFNNDC